MSVASITSVAVVNNPAPFNDPIVVEVTYDCLSELREDLEWKIIYVGSAESEEFDQILDSAFVGPVVAGTFKFRMEAPPPDPAKIPRADVVGVTALLITGSYRGQEFVRVGYYVNNEYTDPELAGADPPPDPPLVARLQRNILTEHPRVTKFVIGFDDDADAERENQQPSGDVTGDMDTDALKQAGTVPEHHQQQQQQPYASPGAL